MDLHPYPPPGMPLVLFLYLPPCSPPLEKRLLLLQLLLLLPPTIPPFWGNGLLLLNLFSLPLFPLFQGKGLLLLLLLQKKAPLFPPAEAVVGAVLLQFQRHTVGLQERPWLLPKMRGRGRGLSLIARHLQPR